MTFHTCFKYFSFKSTTIWSSCEDLTLVCKAVKGNILSFLKMEYRGSKCIKKGRGPRIEPSETPYDSDPEFWSWSDEWLPITWKNSRYHCISKCITSSSSFIMMDFPRSVGTASRCVQMGVRFRCHPTGACSWTMCRHSTRAPTRATPMLAFTLSAPRLTCASLKMAIQVRRSYPQPVASFGLPISIFWFFF